MLNRLKDTLADFIQQADLVLLGICSTATLYGIVLVFSATRYLDPSKGLRRMITQCAALGLGVCVYIFFSMLDLESITAVNNGLMEFKSNVLFSSHDHQFIQTVANRIIELKPEGFVDRVCTYDEYLEKTAGVVV